MLQQYKPRNTAPARAKSTKPSVASGGVAATTATTAYENQLRTIRTQRLNQFIMKLEELHITLTKAAKTADGRSSMHSAVIVYAIDLCNSAILALKEIAEAADNGAHLLLAAKDGEISHLIGQVGQMQSQQTQQYQQMQQYQQQQSGQYGQSSFPGQQGSRVELERQIRTLRTSGRRTQEKNDRIRQLEDQLRYGGYGGAHHNSKRDSKEENIFNKLFKKCLINIDKILDNTKLTNPLKDKKINKILDKFKKTLITRVKVINKYIDKSHAKSIKLFKKLQKVSVIKSKVNKSKVSKSKVSTSKVSKSKKAKSKVSKSKVIKRKKAKSKVSTSKVIKRKKAKN
jgi:hypothetical protein